MKLKNYVISVIIILLYFNTILSIIVLRELETINNILKYLGLHWY